MFGFGKSDLHKSALVVKEGMEESSFELKAKVGHTINMYHTFMVKKFGSLQSFISQNEQDIVEYQEKLNKASELAMNKSEDNVVFGIMIWQLYLTSLIVKDKTAIDVWQELIYKLSEKGDAMHQMFKS